MTLSDSDYIEWAITGILGYYRKFQEMERQYPEISLRGPNSQFSWVHNELGSWRDLESVLHG